MLKASIRWFYFTLVLAVKPWAQVLSIGTMVIVGAWLWRRPEGSPGS